MPRSMDPHKGEVATRLHAADLRPVVEQFEVLEGGLGVVGLAGPFEFHGPGEVAEPWFQVNWMIRTIGVILVLGGRGRDTYSCR